MALYPRELVLVIAAAVQVLATLVLLVLLLYLTYRLVRWFLTILIRGPAAFQGSPAIRLISFAITLWFFPQVPSYLTRTASSSLNTLLVSIPRTLSGALTQSLNECAGDALGDCALAVGQITVLAWSTLAGAILSSLHLDTFPLSHVIFFFAAWTLLAWAIQIAVSKAWTGAAAVRPSGLLQGYKKFAPATRQNTILILFLIVAGFLSLSSIAAIEILGADEPPEVVTDKDLRVQLQKLKLSDDAFEGRFPAGIEPVRRPAVQARAEGAGIDPVAVVAQSLDTYYQRSAELVGAWQGLRLDYLQRQGEMLELGVVTFELANLNRRGGRERSEHFLDIQNWYRRWLQEAHLHLSECRSLITLYNTSLRNYSGMLLLLSSETDMTGGAQFTAIAESGREIGKLASEAGRACEPQRAAPDVPARPEFGSSMGLFALLFRWIIATESLTLALITGVMGFGLLGAGISTFVREGVRGEAGQPWVRNLPAVIARGASASLLVFLAVYGGLLIFSAQETVPDPHVVLFACLVAAVFSEDVWKWARRRMGNAINSSSDDTSEPPKREP